MKRNIFAARVNYYNMSMRKHPIILLSLIALFCCCGKAGTEQAQKMNTPEDLPEETFFGVSYTQKRDAFIEDIHDKDVLRFDSVIDGRYSSSVWLSDVHMGLNIDTTEQGVVRSVCLLTSDSTQASFACLRAGVEGYYGKPNIVDGEGDRVRCSWYFYSPNSNNSITLRHLHTEDGGFALFFEHDNKVDR